MIYPYDDEYLVYDYDEHRYILTEKAVLDKNNISLIERLNFGGAVNQAVQPQVFLDEISDVVYGEIYDYSSQPAIQEKQIAKCPSARRRIMKAMLKQVDYVLVNGLLAQYSGVDVRKGTKSPDFSERVLAPLAKKELTKPLDETGIPLMYAGKYPYIFKPDYEKDNY